MYSIKCVIKTLSITYIYIYIYCRINKIGKIIKLLCGFCLQLLYTRLKFCIFY